MSKTSNQFKTIVQAIKKLTSGKYEINLKTTGVNSEYDQLCELLNNLASSIDQNVDDLQKENDQFEELINMLPVAVFETDENGNFTFVNKTAYKIFKYTKKDFENGLNALQMIIPEERKRAVQSMQDRKTGKLKKASEYTALTKNGKQFPILLQPVGIIKEGEFIGFRGYVLDISELKGTQRKLQKSKDEMESMVNRQTEELKTAIELLQKQVLEHVKTEKALRKSEGKLAESINYVENILMSMADSLFVIDSEAKIKTVNNSILHLLDYKIDELIGEDVRLILEEKYYEKNNNDKFQGFFKDLIKTEFVKNHEMYLKDSHGEIIPVNISGSVIYDDSGGIDGLVCIAHDLREIRNATAQVVQSEKLAALGQLTAGLAHELNQPLNNIMIIAQSLTRDIQKGRLDEEELKGDLNEVVEHVNKMSSIISHTRIFSRDAENENVDFVDLNQVVKNSLKFVNAQLRVHNFKVNLEMMDDIPEVPLNSIQIEQVLLNFITNARSSVERSKKEERKICIKTSHNNGMAIVEICDNGEGVPEHLQSKIFQPFFTTKDKGKGTGLGLSVAKKIIESHNGKIELDSTPGEGATFRVMLPLQRK